MIFDRYNDISPLIYRNDGIDLTKAVRLAYSHHCVNCYPMEKACENIMKQ